MNRNPRTAARALLASCLIVPAVLAGGAGVAPAQTRPAQTRPAEARPAASAPVTAESLLGEFADLSAVADFPSPAFTTAQSSSYDRRSTSPDADGWFGNNDRAQYVRTEQRDGRTEYVMLDAKGPGAVVRVWSATPTGVLRVYLDGGETPAIEGDMADLLGGAGAVPEPLAQVRSQGYSLYLPIPYEKSCRVTQTEGKSYYTVDYRTYAPGTAVTTLAPGGLDALRPAIRKAADAMAGAVTDPASVGVEPDQTRAFDVTVEPGEASPPLRLQGPAAITRLAVRVEAVGPDGGAAPAATPEQAEAGVDPATPARRGVVLQMTFDGEPTVDVPVADFFVAAGAADPFATLPLSVGDDGEMQSRWVMPFGRDAEVSVRNLGRTPVRLRGAVGTADRAWTDRSMHFRATYHARYDLPARPIVDLTHLDATGEGAFVGLALTIDNPVRAWWGEGDEKVYVDGETFPSWFGTGSEDYFGFAWCDPTPYTHALHAQPHSDGPANRGRTTDVRVHLADRIPFTQSLKFDMENWHSDKAAAVNVATVAYWYARPGATQAGGAVTAADVVDRPVPPYVPVRVVGAIEGEAMEVLASTGKIGPQEWEGVSGGRHLWWRQADPGDVLAVRFSAAPTVTTPAEATPAAGRYRVFARFLTAPDYGTVRLEVNGRPAEGQPIDLYGPAVRPSEEVDLGTFDLKPEGNELSVQLVGANDAAIKRFLFGLDYLRLEPAP